MVVPAARKASRTPRKEQRAGYKLPESSSEYIKTITQLKRRPRSEEALFVLHQVASLVKPVMKACGLKVGILCEFFPKDGRLLGLNVNHGVKICLRLRPASDVNSFLPVESIIGTMLHELTHNKFGPHDNKFYAYLDEMTVQMERVIAGGYTGEGFFSQGNVLGGAPKVSLYEARQKALAAVERRKVLFAGSGQKLGGANSGLSMREKVRQAAERRQADSKWCASERAEQVDLEESDQEVQIRQKPADRPEVKQSGEENAVVGPEEEAIKELNQRGTTNRRQMATKRRIQVVLLGDDEDELSRWPTDDGAKRGKTDAIFIDLTDETRTG
jgi:hypothetical protein